MKLYLPATLFIVLFSSCTTYQYMTVNSSSTGKNEQKDFVVENDSVRVQYNFNGADAPVNILIQNKLNQPMYIDWKRSALIINDRAVSYVAEKIPISGVIGASTYNYSYYSTTTYGGLYAEARVPGQTDFIPPQSYITKTPLRVSNCRVEGIPDTSFKKENVIILDGSVRRLKRATFTEDDSPLRFKSYLTFITGDSLNKAVTYQHSFYISEIINTDMAPANFEFMNQKLGDHFYVSNITGFGKGFGVVAGVAVLGAAAAMTPNNQDNGAK
jgi:hypothetical protein